MLIALIIKILIFLISMAHLINNKSMIIKSKESNKWYKIIKIESL